METSTLTFGEPLWLWALILVPLLGVLFIWANRRASVLLSKLVATRLLSSLIEGVSYTRRTWRMVLLLVGLTALIIAMAQPRWGYEIRESKQKGRDVIIAMDVSRSMLASDLSPSRLVRAKLSAQDLLNLLKGDRVGVIAFAGKAFLQAPLTLDHSEVLSTIEELDTTIIPEGGTNIASAIRLAIEAFGKAEGTSRALVLFTDGEELDEDGVATAKVAKEAGIQIYTVGVATVEGSPIQIQTERGGTDVVRDATGKPVISKLDQVRLEEIAAVTGGFFQMVGPQAARNIFNQGIASLEKSEFGEMSARRPIERYQWPLGLAILCLMASFGLGERKARKHLRREGIKVATLIVLVSMWHSIAYADAMKSYHEGKYDEALKEFSSNEFLPTEEYKLQYNAGNAAYKLGDYDKAISYFTKALLTKDPALRKDASYNLANALVRRGESDSTGEKKVGDWKNAIQHYEEALRLQPKDQNAKYNKELVEKLLKQEEEKQNKDQQNKDQQNKDQQNKDQQNKDQQNKDQQNKDQQNKDQQNKDQQNKDQQNKDQQNKDQQNKDQQNKDQQNKDQQNKDQQNKDQQELGDQDRDKQQPQPGSKPTPQPEPSSGDKKEGEIKSANESQEDQKAEAQPTEAEEQQDGVMSEAQARALLRSLQGEEDRVKIMQPAGVRKVTKDW